MHWSQIRGKIRQKGIISCFTLLTQSNILSFLQSFLYCTIGMGFFEGFFYIFSASSPWLHGLFVKHISLCERGSKNSPPFYASCVLSSGVVTHTCVWCGGSCRFNYMISCGMRSFLQLSSGGHCVWPKTVLNFINSCSVRFCSHSSLCNPTEDKEGAWCGGMGYNDMHHTGVMQHSLVSGCLGLGMRHKEGNLSLPFASKVNLFA